MSELHKSLTTFRGTMLLMNIVVGAGLLSLPGLSVAEVGDHAFWSWVFCAIAAIPLLMVFIIMGSRYPNAGGAAFFVSRYFGDYGYGVGSMMLLGAVCFGIPSVALSGGYYAAEIFPGNPAFYAAFLMLIASLVHLFAVESVAKFSAMIASGVIVFLIAFIAMGFIDFASSETSEFLFAPIQDIDFVVLLTPFMMIFFAFTGWEVGAGSSEEFRNPKRDFPRAMIYSYFAVTILYLVTVFIVQVSEVSSNPVSSFAGIADNALGIWGRYAMAFMACLIIFANLIGAVWAISRMIYALSREGYLPIKLTVNERGTPITSVMIFASINFIVLTLQGTGVIDLSFMLSLAGQNFLVLFGLVSMSLFMLSKGVMDRLVSLSAFVIVIILMILEGQFILYPIGVALFGIGVTFIRSRRQQQQ